MLGVILIAPPYRRLSKLSGRADNSVQRRYGGTNYLQKPMPAEAILEAVADAVARSRPRQHALHQISPLTKRERQVLLLLAEGMSNKQIAFELKLSQKTIEYHRSSFTTKVGTGDMSAIISLGRLLEGVI